MALRKPNERKENKKGWKFLIYGTPGSGKTPFSLTFPKQLFVDSDDGAGDGTGIYSNENVLIESATLSFKELKEDLDAIEGEDKLFNSIETITVDSISRFYENQQHSALKVVDQRARKNKRLVEGEGLSVKEWGRIALDYDLMYGRFLEYAQIGKTIVILAEQKDRNENIGGQPTKVGVMPNAPKNVEHDFDIVIRTYKDDMTGEVFGEVLKDRTEKFKVGDTIEKPSYNHWADVIEKRKDGKEVSKDKVVSMEKQIDKQAEEFDEDFSILKNEINSVVQQLSANGKKQFAGLLKKEFDKINFKDFMKKEELNTTLKFAKEVLKTDKK